MIKLYNFTLQASPGNLHQMEEIVFGKSALPMSSKVVSLRLGHEKGRMVSYCQDSVAILSLSFSKHCLDGLGHDNVSSRSEITFHCLAIIW